MDLLDSEGHEVTPVLTQPKRFALLVYLACATPKGPHRRDSLLALFWPERDGVNARNALSQSLSFLRGHLPAGALGNRGAEEVWLEEGSARTDVSEFEAAIAAGRWKDALELYRGDFLSGFHLGGALAFDKWMETERERLREDAAGAAWALAQEQIAGGELVEAERTAQRASGLVWSDETPVREFMSALARAGDGVAALKFYERFCQKIRAELDTEPSPETRHLAEAIRRGGPVPEPRDRGPHPPPWPSPQPSERMAVSTSLEAPRTSGPWKLWFWSLAFAAAVCFAAAGILRIRWTLGASVPPPGDRPFTVLADVEGSAPVDLREATAFLLRTGLDMAYVVQTVPEAEVQRTLELMDKDPGLALDRGLARAVAIRLGVSTVVVPRLDHIGNQYVLGMRVEDVEGGILNTVGRWVTRDDANLVPLIDEGARQLRRWLGETRATLAATQTLPQVLTPSLEALKEYQLAGEDGPGQAGLAVAHLRRAVALDTAFAMAWQLMASFYGNYLNEPDSADSARRHADRFRTRLTEARRRDMDLHRRMTEDVALWDVALKEAEEAVRRDPRYLNNYSVYTAFPGGLPDSALNIRFRLETEGAERARRFRPNLPFATSCFINTHYLAAALDRMDEWQTLLQSQDIELPRDCGQEAALFESLAAGEWDRVDSMVRHATGDWRWPTAVETALLQTVPLRGRIRAASETPALARPETRGVRPDSSGLSNISHLLLQLAYDLPLEDASEETYNTRKEPRELEGRGWNAVRDYVLYGVRESLLGDTSEARRVARRLQAMRDTATSRTFERAFEPWFVLMEVGPAWQRGDWPAVIERLGPMAERIHEPRVGHLAGDDYLCWWVLADAYIHLDDNGSGIRYLESILQRPRFRRDNWMVQGFIHPAARFRLAGLRARAGDDEGAREEYRVFLETFTDPDPEFLWMVEEARNGVGALEGG